MRYTESPEAKAEREYIAKVNQILEGGGCWLTETVDMRRCCLGPKRKGGAADCKSCEAYIDFYRIANTYYEEPGITWSEAIWLARQFLGIKSSYMCNGYNGEGMDSKTYEACLKRQAELMGEQPAQIEETPIEEPEKQLTGQMSILDWFNEN